MAMWNLFFLSAKMARNYSERLDFAQMLSKVGRLRNFCQTAPEKMAESPENKRRH